MGQQFRNMVTGELRKPEEWQEQLSPGDFYMIEQPFAAVAGVQLANIPPVFGQVLRRKSAGYCKVRAFSYWCPDGEIGEISIVDPTRKLTTAEFEQARQNNWEKL